MKKTFLLGMVVPFAMTAFVVGCRGMDSSDKIDATKTQIYVNNFKRGFGSKWLDELKRRFEEKHAESSFEEGKKGVEVIIHNIGSTADSRMANIASGIDEVYFTEQSYYYDLLKYKGLTLLDITDAVQAPLTEYGETRSIEDKLTDEQKDYLCFEQEDHTSHYYALPHYSGYFGLQIDVDVFDEENLYFADDPESQGGFPWVRNASAKKSAGPDGVYDTYDDGLPRTFDEFFQLCEYMSADKGIIPLVANGQNATDYLNLLVNGIAADHEGKANMVAKFKASGVVNDLGTVGPSGTVTVDATPTTLTIDNGYQAYRSLGYYYGLDFLKRIINGKYYYRGATGAGGMDSTAYSAKSAQDDFLISFKNKRTGKNEKDIAMISEGIWWENESSSTSDQLSGGNPDSIFSKQNRKFAFLPFPKATEERYNQSNKNTLFDHLFSLMFAKGNIPEWKKPLVKDFMKFCNSDESLREFTRVTNTPKALDYELTDADKAEMTYYGKTLAELKERSDVVYPGNSSAIYQLNSSFFHTDNQYQTNIGGIDNKYIINKIKTVSSKEYFDGMFTFYRSYWKNLNKPN